MSTRAVETRASLLAAAARVFCSDGYHDTSVAGIVAEANASVGSLYHHFGAKSDLYTALFEEYAQRQEERAAGAVKAARETGESDLLALFVAGARAYLIGCWGERSLTRLFHTGDGPPGFETLRRRRYRHWTRRNQVLLHAPEDPAGTALVLVLTTVLSEAGHEVALLDDEAAAEQLAEQVLVLIARIGGERPLS